MKTSYEKIFAQHVGSKLQKAKDLGIKASWTTANHLDALAECIAAHPVEQARDILGECYNVSAYQQLLAKRFEKLGHFQREGKKSAPEALDDMLSRLAAEHSQG